MGSVGSWISSNIRYEFYDCISECDGHYNKSNNFSNISVDDNNTTNNNTNDNVENTKFKYSYNTENKTATLIGFENSDDYDTLEIPSTTTKDNIKYTVTGIGNGAFAKNLKIYANGATYAPQSYTLSNVIIPNTVTSIGKYAFVNVGLKSITLSNNITKISDGAF